MQVLNTHRYSTFAPCFNSDLIRAVLPNLQGITSWNDVSSSPNSTTFSPTIDISATSAMFSLWRHFWLDPFVFGVRVKNKNMANLGTPIGRWCYCFRGGLQFVLFYSCFLWWVFVSSIIWRSRFCTLPI